MRTFIKWLLIALAVAVISLAIWGYAPDRDPEELRAEYGQQPSQYVKLPSGQNIHLRDEGPKNAPAILLLHGSSSSLHTWQEWTENLSRDYRIIRYDQPGHGLTGPHVSKDYTAKGYSDTAAAVMQYLDIDTYVIAGNSMGGWVAWNHTLAYPDNVRGLILVDASGAPDAQPKKLPIGFRLANSRAMRPLMKVFTPRSIIKASLETSVGDPSRITNAQIDRYWNLIKYPGNREAIGDRSDVARIAAKPEQMADIKVPALVMWGAKDTLIPVPAAKWFDTHIQDSTAIIYDDLGHIPMEEDGARTAVDVGKWLSDNGLAVTAGNNMQSAN
ncbi:alpha/beta hydrolase [Sphingorhabdus sp. Alg239-R122]|uniref:alpha/beta fold hydrolase n=1 Tax=Sphingorhabdus sp. Alg239-R122 TaxID=2305989 RepID=UPI0013DB6ED4|nr:alpha/beta hydrolase [Sphingorhabdus sp. Alg239-R122]